MKSNNINAGATNASSTSGEGGQNPVVTPTKPPIRDHELSKDCWCQPTVDGEAPDEVSLGEQIEHQRSIYGGDIETFGTESEWTIKSGSILASLLELQIRRDSAPSAPAAETMAVPKVVIDFLCGAGPLDGVHFGDKHPTERGNFWWRNYLRDALRTAANG